MQKPSSLLKRFGDDTRGAIAIIFGLSTIVLIMMVGLSVDSSRAYNTATKIQTALDAAALAGAKLLDVEGANDADVLAKAQAYFNARLPSLHIEGAMAANFRTDIVRGDSRVTALVDVTVPNLFGSIGGLAPTMTFTPSSAVVYKAKKVELSLVLDITGSMSANGKIDALKTAAKDMVDVFFSSNPSAGAVKVALVPYSAAVNVGAYVNAVTPDPNPGDTCVIERDVTEVFTGAAAVGVDQVDAFYDDDHVDNDHYFCPAAQVIPLTDLAQTADRNNFKTQIDNLTPGGWTAGHIGAAWGWYTISPQWSGIWPSASAPKPYSGDIIKAVVIMTDGEFNTSYRNGAQNAACGTPGAWNPDSGCSQALQLCQNMKAAGVQVYTIGLQTLPTSEAMLQECAGAGNFYNTDTSSQLIGAFRDIVEKLTSLRITS